jgi:hypothetical protein
MKFRRAWRPKQAVPGIGAKTHNAGQRTLRGPEANRPHER